MREREQSAIDRLARLGGDALVSDLAALYRDQMLERLAEARDAIGERDVTRLCELAHAMRSSSAQLGADEIAQACEAVEEAAGFGDIEEVAAGVAEIETYFQAFSERLRDWAARAASRAGPLPDDVAPARGVVRPVIAVIEDNADNRLLLDAILGDRFVLDEYETGASALSGMAVRRPDLVLLDVSLPGMDGLEVLARIRADAALSGVPVIAVTAHAMAGDRERYLEAGFDGYVAKPIVAEDTLVGAIARLLDSRRSSR